ncbi:MAG: AAC(3) family N-acetyltransferase [Huintestinicola sp.]
MSCLFMGSDGREYAEEDILNALKAIGADDCNALFIHSDIMFGTLAKGVKRNDYLYALENVFSELGVKHLLFPTFTYSFCNNEDFSVADSRTSMGAFNEYMRKKDGRYRTSDPILSLSVPMELKDRFSSVSEHSLGEGSGLDAVHHMDGVKFLFFGARMGNCFTYVHYAEKILDVPYRFDMPFSGKITDENGNTFTKTQYIHTACFGVKPADFYYFEDELEEKGLLKKAALGDKTVSCIDEKTAYSEIVNKLNGDIYYFLEQPFTKADLLHKYTKGLDGSRITHC